MYIPKHINRLDVQKISRNDHIIGYVVGLTEDDKTYDYVLPSMQIDSAYRVYFNNLNTKVIKDDFFVHTQLKGSDGGNVINLDNDSRRIQRVCELVLSFGVDSALSQLVPAHILDNEQKNVYWMKKVIVRSRTQYAQLLVKVRDERDFFFFIKKLRGRSPDVSYVKDSSDNVAVVTVPLTHLYGVLLQDSLTLYVPLELHIAKHANTSPSQEGVLPTSAVGQNLLESNMPRLQEKYPAMQWVGGVANWGKKLDSLRVRGKLQYVELAKG